MTATVAIAIPWWFWLVLGACLLLILVIEWRADD